MDKGPEHDHESMPKTKKKKADVVDRQQRVQARLEELKKHGTSFTSPQYRFWAEALEVGSHTSVDDPPPARLYVRRHCS